MSGSPGTVAPAAAQHEVYLVQSSLQFMLAAALAVDGRIRGSARSTLLFVPDVLDPDLFARGLDGAAGAPFDATETVQPRRRPGERRKSRDWRALVDEVRERVRCLQPDILTVFNDRQDTGQAALDEMHRRFPSGQRRCAEDGALAYTGFRYRTHSSYTRLRQRWRLGRAWHDVTVLGTHPLVQCYVALRPALLRSELRTQHVEPFPVEALASAPMQALAARLCAAAGTDVGRVRETAVLLTLGHSTYAERNPAYIQAVRRCVDALVSQRRPFAFKYHPREAAPDPMALTAVPQAHELSRVLPVECLYLLWGTAPLTVIGGMSTSLLTAALLLPSARVVALQHASSTGDQWSPALVEALHIASAA